MENTEKVRLKKPNPGSKEAVRQGCRCPVFDNDHGKGCGYSDSDGKPVFWYSPVCPVHVSEVGGHET